jgi:hypothetical protein
MFINISNHNAQNQASLFILTFFLFFTPPLSTFSPTDNYLISCGSTIDNRRFISDSHPNSPLLSSTETIPLTNQNPSPNYPQIYNTARIFKTPSKYAFEVKEPGTRMVSLHFYPSFSSIPDLDDAQFHVLVNGHVDLGNFSVGKVRDFAAKEYFIRVDSVKVVINFVPTKKGNFGFFNAIEVISAPKRFDCSWDFLLMVMICECLFSVKTFSFFNYFFFKKY